MFELFSEIDVNEEQADAIARGLYAVATADGDLHPQERAIIREFYAAGHESAADLAALERMGAIEPDTLAAILSTAEVRQLFLGTAVLCAWSDGDYGPKESALIEAYASACGIGAQDLADLQAQVKEFMLSQLAHLQNVDAAVEVKKELDL